MMGPCVTCFGPTLKVRAGRRGTGSRAARDSRGPLVKAKCHEGRIRLVEFGEEQSVLVFTDI